MSEDAAVFGKYRLIAELGHGGMAEVYLAISHGPAGFNKLVVIKKLRANLAEDPDFVAMLLDEARLAARLNHPNVVQTNEVGEVEGVYFISMEYLDGQPLHRIIRAGQKGGKVTQGMLYGILVDVLAGLQHAHELADFDGTPLHVVHRDVSPHNVFVTYDGQVKVVDFGIAKAARRSTAETEQGILKGKIGYMSPEQAVGDNPDARADVFAVGIMLWEAATGKRMWADVDQLKILQRLLTGDVPRAPRDIDPNVPVELDRICQKALAQKREDRFESARDMQQELEKFLLAEGQRSTPRELSSAITTLFQDERSKKKEIIDRKLRGAEIGNLSGPMNFTETGLTPAITGSQQFAVPAAYSEGKRDQTDLTGATRLSPITVQNQKKQTWRLAALAGAAVGLAGAAYFALRGANDAHPHEGATPVSTTQLLSVQDAGAPALPVVDAAVAPAAPTAAALTGTIVRPNPTAAAPATGRPSHGGADPRATATAAATTPAPTATTPTKPPGDDLDSRK